MQVRKALAAFRPVLPTSVFTALADKRWYGGNAIAIALVFGVAAFTTQSSYAENATIEEVVVTGSLLKRDSFASASPLKVIDDVELKAEATPALGEVISNQTFNYGSDIFSNNYTARFQEGNSTGCEIENPPQTGRDSPNRPRVSAFIPTDSGEKHSNQCQPGYLSR